MAMFGADDGILFTPTVQNAAYSASNVMGGLQTVNVFSGDFVSSGILTGFMISSKSGQTAAMTIYIFDANPTASTFTDKSALSLANADVGKLALAPFILTPAVPQGATASVAELAITRSVRNHDSTPASKLYIAIVANATVTPGSATDLLCKISLSQD